MRNILVKVSYDGTDFCGWQRQDGHGAHESVRTVQGVLEDAIARLHGQRCAVCASGRTDSGVHAAGQAATFLSPIDSIPIARYPRAINCFLPDDVRILSAKEVPRAFSARFSATSRIYRYFISTDELPPAILPRYAWCIHRDVDVARLNALAGELRGECDCASFAATDGNDRAAAGSGGEDAHCGLEGGGAHSTKRYIDGMRFFDGEAFPASHIVVFEIEANAFLYHMVRNLVGTLLQAEQRRAGAGALAAIAAALDRRAAGPTAPPQGLFLWDVKFDGVRRHK